MSPFVRNPRVIELRNLTRGSHIDVFRLQFNPKGFESGEMFDSILANESLFICFSCQKEIKGIDGLEIHCQVCNYFLDRIYSILNHFLTT